MNEKIFNKLSQVQARGCGVFVGNGIGLCFGKTAIEELGGRIWMERPEGQRANVMILLPLGEYSSP